MATLFSRFDLHQRVYPISMTQPQRWVDCTFCEGSGHIVGADARERFCPECSGRRGEKVYENRRWMVGSSLTVGQIRVEATAEISDEGESIFDNFGNRKARLEESYMMRETGIGSGTIHSPERLFKTPEEAQTEVDQRNAIIESERAVNAVWLKDRRVYHTNEKCPHLRGNYDAGKALNRGTVYEAKTERSLDLCQTCAEPVEAEVLA